MQTRARMVTGGADALPTPVVAVLGPLFDDYDAAFVLEGTPIIG